MKKALIVLMFIATGFVCAQETFFLDKNAYIQSPKGGCMLGDRLYPVGTREQMNKIELALYKEKTGYRASDGHAIMMECLYLVNPLHDDHPKIEDRVYVWVAS